MDDKQKKVKGKAETTGEKVGGLVGRTLSSAWHAVMDEPKKEETEEK